ncbi:competence type IV pilus minor pilin ComGF [Bacillus carboniphilus]|uniref:Competence type IV pilus minor pilin ComGF n=1 Tax=Bacillus carboniphilus TaxID=86663 RepID=A0ABY9JYQ8_9BACI|nr:competence type IV pilus minor pilin ComGF [Bacillus carboniphilus]WLR43919.1 competence type IV pilus minor pilin ComGF [Bacillus carboniphilus]
MFIGKGKIRYRKYVQNLLYDEGYTYAHLLLNLLITSIILSSLLILFPYLKQITALSTDVQPFEWNVFLQQVQREMIGGKELSVDTTSFTFYDVTGEKITIEKYGNIIRRKVNNSGHDIMLQRINGFSCEKVKNGVILKVSNERGTEYEATIRLYNQFEAES